MNGNIATITKQLGDHSLDVNLALRERDVLTAWHVASSPWTYSIGRIQMPMWSMQEPQKNIKKSSFKIWDNTPETYIAFTFNVIVLQLISMLSDISWWLSQLVDLYGYKVVVDSLKRLAIQNENSWDFHVRATVMDEHLRSNTIEAFKKTQQLYCFQS